MFFTLREELSFLGDIQERENTSVSLPVKIAMWCGGLGSQRVSPLLSAQNATCATMP